MTPEDEEFERIAKEIRRNAKEDDDIQEYKRPWVGLTKEELEQLCYEWRIIYSAHVEEFIQDITDKLRSKNNE